MSKKDDKKGKNYRLTTTLSFTKQNGLTVTISTLCADWKLMQKFLSDFENNMLKGNDGKTQHQDRS